MDTKIFEQLEAVFGQEIQLVRHDLAALETMIQEKMRLLGNGLLQRAVKFGQDNRACGLSAVLALRISWLNKEWDKLWLMKPLAA